MVTYEGEKMSKSIGNTVSPGDMLALAGPRVVRYFLGQAHYRSQLDYRPSSLAEAGAAVARIDTFVSNAQGRIHETGQGGEFGFVAHHSEVTDEFAAAMDDDLNVPQALAALHDTVRRGNTALAAGDLDAADVALRQVMAMTRVLGLDDAVDPAAATDGAGRAALEVLVEAQLEARAAARSAKDWARADGIRDTLAAAGIVVEDSADGARWSLG